jgi:hypothetical protein
MNLKEVEDYLGITDNNNYMYKAEVIMQFRLLEKLITNMDYEKLEVILKEDYYHLGLDNKIVYEYKDLIVYEENNNIRS